MHTNYLAVRPILVSLLGFGLIGGLTQLAGCAAGASASKPAALAPTPTQITDSPDGRFLAAAERSSTWAVHMSDLVLARGETPEVRAVAKQIKAREAAHLELLAAERGRLGLAPTPADDHADAHMRQDEERLAAASGHAADSLYIQHMIEQRRDIIALANYARGEISSPTLANYAKSLPVERYRDVGDLTSAGNHAHAVPANSRAALGIKTGPSAPTATPRR